MSNKIQTLFTNNDLKSWIKRFKADPNTELEKLTVDGIAQIYKKAKDEYHNSGKPLFTDAEFDYLEEYFRNLNPNHAELTNVGSLPASSHHKKEALPYYLGSLNKIKDDDHKDIAKFCTTYGPGYVLSDKLDGYSGLIYIDKENQIKLYTRGVGTTGSNISHLIPLIKNLPTKDQINLLPVGVAIRGELVISKKDFDIVNPKKEYATLRNCLSSVVNSKVPDRTLASVTQFVAYEVIHPVLAPSDQMNKIKELGFKCVSNKLVKDKILTTDFLLKELFERRETSEFVIDGIVLSHDKIHPREKGIDPRSSFAFKSIKTQEVKETTVVRVEYNISKNGLWVPTIKVNLVHVGGVNVRSLTGFNARYVVANGIGPGSVIQVARAGDVIPQIVGIVSRSTSGEPQMPPQEYEWSASDAHLILPENKRKGNKDFQFKQIECFFELLEIAGLSSGNLKKIFNAKYETVKAILDMQKDDFLKVNGFQSKMANKLFDGISERIKFIEPVTLMVGSNVFGEGIGTTKIGLILDACSDITTKQHVPSVEELLNISSIREKTAAQFLKNLPLYFEFIKINGLDKMDKTEAAVRRKLVPKVQNDSFPRLPASFDGQIVVLTQFRNKDLEALIVERGGKVGAAITKKTTLIICEDRSNKDQKSKKIAKALSEGIAIEEFSQYM